MARGLGRFFRRGLFGRVFGVGTVLYRYLTTSDGRTIETSDGCPVRTSEDLRFLRTSPGKILHTSDGRPFFTKVN